MNRIDRKFRELSGAGRKALITYIMAADPDMATTERLIPEIEKAGADIIELGVPFTDPLADGPVIEQAAARALRNRPRTREIFELVARLRRVTEVPVVLMLYYNLVFKYGVKRFISEAAAAGVDGLIIPDLPPEEAGEAMSAGREYGIAIIFLAAPTSTTERLELITKVSCGFLYYVALTGITGAKIDNIGDVNANITGVKKMTALPVAAGFGVKTPQDAKELAAAADGVIVGTAIVRLIEQYQGTGELIPRVTGLVRELRSAIG